MMTLKWKGGKRLMSALRDQSGWRATVERHMQRATQLNALVAEASIRDIIKGGGFEANAPLTSAIKRSSKPLVDKGDLFKAITSQPRNAFEAFVGILMTDGLYDVALAVHDGVSIKVTDKMRNMFYVLWQASIGEIPASKLEGRAAELFARYKNWRPLRESTSNIVIPARPFIRKAFQSRELRAKVKAHWELALTAAFRELASRAR